MLVYHVYHDSVVLHEQEHHEVWIVNHKHHVLATHLSLTYTSSVCVADLLWQAVLDNFPGDRHEVIYRVK